MKKLFSVHNVRSFLTSIIALIFLLSMVIPLKAEASELPKEPDCKIVYQFANGATYTVLPEIAMTLMLKNEDGSYYIDPATGYYVIDPSLLYGFLTALQVTYPPASNGGSAGFKTTRGDILPIYNVQQEGYMDIREEMNYLACAIMEQKKENHSPALCAGGTYVEVDITNQMLYYYADGVAVITTPVVTGLGGGRTPTGVFTVGNKSTNTTLTGADYSSFVYYWMPIYGNKIGIHDATWRSSFGGSIYLSNGSHGCINVPLSVMKDLYAAVAQGTQVVVFK